MNSIEDPPELKSLSRREKIEFYIEGLSLNEADAKTLKKLQLDLDELLMLNDDDMIKLGLKDSEMRKKLNKMVEKFKGNTAKIKKNDNDNQDNKIIAQDSTFIVNNLSKHLEYIHDTLIFAGKKLQTKKCRNIMLSNQHSLADAFQILTNTNYKQNNLLIDNLKILQNRFSSELVQKKKKKNGHIYLCLGILLSTTLILGISTWKIRSEIFQ